MASEEWVFSCPVDCLPGVGEVFGGQYSLPSGLIVSGTPKVLDIGANVGAFTVWARLNWPGCHVVAYEPQPDVFEHLRSNVGTMPNVVAINAAVSDCAHTVMLRGQNSRLCSSLIDIGEQSSESVQVNVVHPKSLEAADIVKLDCEGGEAYILENLTFIPRILLVEWHGNAIRRRVELAVEPALRLIASRNVALERGIYVYARES